MPKLICPVCGGELIEEERRWYCPSGHSFDRAASGYVNLLISRQNGGQHGDDKGMVRARRDFLDKGYYAPLREAICRQLLNCVRGKTADILDSGCGECYYTAALEKALEKAGIDSSIVGVDISKDALKMGDKRGKNLKLAVASAYRLPIADESCDMVLNVFAPFAGEEYLRVLKKGGTLLHVCPGELHLWELKKAVYENPYKNDALPPEQPGLEPVSRKELSYRISVDSNADIKALFHMTPYAHKTSPEDIARLEKIDSLELTVEFVLRRFRKL
ncbi:MAG: putative RNA methyltransferase [Candidatus Limivicinus sp.]